MANEIQIRVTPEGVLVRAPYNPNFPPKARSLGGKWNGETWCFDTRDEGRVRSLVRKFYGSDGSEPVSLVCMRVRVDKLGYGEQTIWLVGRQVVHRHMRDSRVRLGDGCVLLKGGFNSSGGSVKNPRISALDGTIVEIRDVPALLAADAVQEDVVWIVGDAEDDEVATKKVTLEARKAQLLAELAGVEAEITALSKPPSKPLTALDRVMAEDSPIM